MRKRSKHNLSHYRMHTTKMGLVVPVSCVPVIPGDTFDHRTSALVRVSPLNTPVMHPVTIRMHHFFVPNRIVWPESENGGWEQFITGGPDGDNTETVPTVPNTTAKTALQYLGVPPAATGEVNALPLRAYNLIWNEFYRDQDLEQPIPLETRALQRIAWEKDYFTTSRPWTQKGSDVTIPISGQVVGDGTVSPVWETLDGTNLGPTYEDVGTGGDEFGLQTSLGVGPGARQQVRFAEGADIGAQVISAGASVNDFREAFAIQRYQEARARYGSRFTEYLRYLGIRPSDARLQRPEYLGGGTTRLNFSEVLQTTPGAEGEIGVGDLYGHGIAGAATPRYRKFFEEHGYVITMFSVRPKSLYLDGAHREFFKKSKEDYFQKELVHLGQQPVYTRELDVEADDGTVFGYQDRYDEYRQQWSYVGEDFRDVLSSWHLGRDFDETPVLNADFIKCRPSDRIYQVATNDTLWCMINHRIIARRLVPKRARPRIL